MTPLSLRRWRASQLLGAWLLYWLALAAAVLWRPALVAWRLSKVPEGHANAGLSFGDGAFDLKFVVDNVTAYHGHASYGAVVLWLVLPPLLLWVVWLLSRPRPAPAPPAELRAGDAPPDFAAPRRDRAPARDERR
jgi:hypothetical protein